MTDKAVGPAFSHVAVGARATPQGTDPIDRAYLARYTFGNVALEREVLELFAAHTGLYVEQLRLAATRKAWKNAAHLIKGSARAVGARRLASLAHVAEQLDVDVLPVGEARRERVVAAVAEGAEEARRYIACLFATA